MPRTTATLALALAAAALGAAALGAAAVPTALAAGRPAASPSSFAVGASAIVLPRTPALAPGATAMTGVYRVGRGVYCVSPAPSLDWTRHTPLVAPLPAQSAKGKGQLLASWDAGGQRCPAAAIEVRTYRLAGAAPTPSSDIAFHVLVGGGD